MIDLHTHTTASDGTDSPFALVNKALSAGITVLGVTDHDTTSGWVEAISAARKPISLALGAEISTLTEDGISVHMLGLLFDGENSEIQAMLSDARDTRIPRMKKMVELLRGDGFSISMEDVIAATPEGATLGRPHLADEAFAELLTNDSKYYVTHATPTPEVAIRTIVAAGGVAVIAHPMASRRGDVISTSIFADLVAAGLHGIEIDHRDHSAIERAELRLIASELNLVITGASDYHGQGKLNSLGENLTDPAQWERLESLASQRRVVTP
jgi:predicted metal-dependent phosphoesterase TrpH